MNGLFLFNNAHWLYIFEWFNLQISRREEVVSYFQFRFLCLPENHKDVSQVSMFSFRDVKPGHVEYESKLECSDDVPYQGILSSKLKDVLKFSFRFRTYLLTKKLAIIIQNFISSFTPHLCYVHS
jgi:hypothetical protein